MDIRSTTIWPAVLGLLLAMGQGAAAATNFNLIVSGSPANYGVSSPYGYGTNVVPEGPGANTMLGPIPFETNLNRYAFAGWTFTNPVTGVSSGTEAEATFTVATNSTLTWRWTRTHYYLTVAVTPGGEVDTASGWFGTNGTVELLATATGANHFVQWSGADVPVGAWSNNPLSIRLDRPMTVQANFAPDLPVTRAWTGTGNWYSNWANWNPPGPPGELDDVILRSGTCALSDPAAVASALISNTLVFARWTTVLAAASNVTVQGAGLITLPAAFNDTTDMSNRVHIVCSNFTLAAGRLVNLDSKGYGTPGVGVGYGPGGGRSASPFAQGGGYGGVGGNRSWLTGGTQPYGSASRPLAPGSGGADPMSAVSGIGGGAALIEASGTVTIHGTISANGGQGSENQGSGGSGGGICIVCGTIAGSGVISAQGGRGALRYGGGTGGGGRIAIDYRPELQAVAPAPSILFTALHGTNTAIGGWPTNMGSLGTVYFPDTTILKPSIARGLSGEICGIPAWTTDSATFNNNWIRFAEPGFRLAVSNNLVVSGMRTRVEVGGDALLRNAHMYYGTNLYGPYVRYSAGPTGVAVSVGGNLVVTGRAAFAVFAGPTNAASGGRGATVAVKGMLQVWSNSLFEAISHPTNGGSVVVEATDVVVASNGLVAAGEGGFAGGNVTSAWGYGGGRLVQGGGGYGGAGGGPGGGATYGSAREPLDPGSGGARGTNTLSTYAGGNGGGAIRIEASRLVRVDGTIAADGADVRTQVGGEGSAGGGSGGAVLIRCRRFEGGPAGLVSASGGSSSMGGGGGGGRIAVWRPAALDRYVGAFSAAAGAGVTPAAQDGTILVLNQTPGQVFFFR